MFSIATWTLIAGDNGTTRLNPREVMLAAPLRPRITNVTVARSKEPAYYGPAGIPAFRNLTALPDDFFYGASRRVGDAREGTPGVGACIIAGMHPRGA